MILTLILVPKAKFFRSAMWDFAQKVEQVNAVSFILNCIYIFPLTVHNNVALYLRNFRNLMQFYHLLVTHTSLIYGDYPVVGYTVLCCNINHLIYYSSYYLQAFRNKVEKTPFYVPMIQIQKFFIHKSILYDISLIFSTLSS